MHVSVEDADFMQIQDGCTAAVVPACMQNRGRRRDERREDGEGK